MEEPENVEVERAIVLKIAEIIEYTPHEVVKKSIIKKTTGNISLLSFDSGESLAEKIIPYDTFVLIIEGRAEILIEAESYILETTQSMIIPAHTANIIRAHERFKMITTIIKSGYE